MIDVEYKCKHTIREDIKGGQGERTRHYLWASRTLCPECSQGPPMPNDNTRYEGHTPEPWEYSTGAVYAAAPRDDDNYPVNRLLLADRDNESTVPVERDANCRLAADAPKLLAQRDELVEALRAMLNNWQGSSYCDIAMNARAALAKVDERGVE